MCTVWLAQSSCGEHAPLRRFSQHVRVHLSLQLRAREIIGFWRRRRRRGGRGRLRGRAARDHVVAVVLVVQPLLLRRGLGSLVQVQVRLHLPLGPRQVNQGHARPEPARDQSFSYDVIETCVAITSEFELVLRDGGRRASEK